MGIQRGCKYLLKNRNCVLPYFMVHRLYFLFELAINKNFDGNLVEVCLRMLLKLQN